MKNQKDITDRNQLISFFTKGNLPNETAFRKLILSTFNKADDRLDIDNVDGLLLYPSDKDKLMSFFEDKDDEEAAWALMISKKPDFGISINKIVQSRLKDNSSEETIAPPAIFIKKEDGKIGIGTNLPDQQLDVRGKIAASGRVGNYREKTLKADGEWHNVFEPKELNGCHAFEIMAYAEDTRGDGKYALLHAIAISTFGNSRPKISKTCAYYGKWWNKIDIRWESRPKRLIERPSDKKRKTFDIARWWNNIIGLLEQKNKHNYNLQLRTKSNFGENSKLSFKVSILWGPDFINSNRTEY